MVMEQQCRYSYKQEVKTQEEFCDDKFVTHQGAAQCTTQYTVSTVDSNNLLYNLKKNQKPQSLQLELSWCSFLLVMLGKLFPHTLHFHVFRLDLTRGEGEAGLLVGGGEGEAGLLAGGGEREYLVEVGEETLALFLILLSIPLFFMFSSTLFLSSSSSSSPSSLSLNSSLQPTPCTVDSNLHGLGQVSQIYTQGQ